MAVPDKVCSLFTNHDASSVRVPANYLGHHRGIHDPQAFHSVHSKLCVHYRHAILFGSHSRRSHRMIDSLFFNVESNIIKEVYQPNSDSAVGGGVVNITSDVFCIKSIIYSSLSGS